MPPGPIVPESSSRLWPGPVGPVVPDLQDVAATSTSGRSTVRSYGVAPLDLISLTSLSMDSVVRWESADACVRQVTQPLGLDATEGLDTLRAVAIHDSLGGGEQAGLD